MNSVFLMAIMGLLQQKRNPTSSSVSKEFAHIAPGYFPGAISFEECERNLISLGSKDPMIWSS